ncbi:hypothetical protein [Streptomyces sp. NPDC005374]
MHVVLSVYGSLPTGAPVRAQAAAKAPVDLVTADPASELLP